MITIIIPWPALIAAFASIGGTAASANNIRRQNEYNDPASQAQRVRDAGLPMAFLTGGSAGNQSALPDTSGIKEAGGHIANYAVNQSQLKSLQLLDAEIKLKENEANLKEAETAWWLKRPGTETTPTNLTTGLNQKQGIETNTLAAGRISNQIQGDIANNTKTRLDLENTKLSAEIANMVQDNQIGKERLEGAELDNKIKTIQSQYTKKMSEQQFQKLLRENAILLTDQAAKQLQLRIDRATESSTIYRRDMEGALSGLTYDRVSEEFENYKQYQKFVDNVQSQIKRTPWESITNPQRTLQAIIEMAYTTVTGLSGQSSGLMQFIK